MGFHSPSIDTQSDYEVKEAMEPEDLLGYGFIPEFIGRLPINIVLHSLGQDSLVRILTEPKNAVVKQFQHLFMLENVELVFTKEALNAAAEQALGRKTGARGLRSIIEESLLDVMYELPTTENVEKCVIDASPEGQINPPVLLSKTGQVIEITTLNSDHSKTA